MSERKTDPADVFAHFFIAAQLAADTHDPERVERYATKMADLRARFPNRWVAYTDLLDQPDAPRWKVAGPFPDEGAAVAWGMTVRPEERSSWTVFFVEAPAEGERVNHPVCVELV